MKFGIGDTVRVSSEFTRKNISGTVYRTMANFSSSNKGQKIKYGYEILFIDKEGLPFWDGYYPGEKLHTSKMLITEKLWNLSLKKEIL